MKLKLPKCPYCWEIVCVCKHFRIWRAHCREPDCPVRPEAFAETRAEAIRHMTPLAERGNP